MLVEPGRNDQAVEPLLAKPFARNSTAFVQAMSDLTRILATHREEAVRNRTEAVRLVTRACVLTGYLEAQVVGTLDAAYAEASRRSKREAVTTPP